MLGSVSRQWRGFGWESPSHNTPKTRPIIVPGSVHVWGFILSVRILIFRIQPFEVTLNPWEQLFLLVSLLFW